VRALFASDLHLSEDRPEANERLIAFLEGKARSADALYLLGDVFEYWIGDDDLGRGDGLVLPPTRHIARDGDAVSVQAQEGLHLRGSFPVVSDQKHVGHGFVPRTGTKPRVQSRICHARGGPGSCPRRRVLVT